MITYHAEGVPMPRFSHRKTTRWIRAVAAAYNKTVGDIGYLFCGDDHILDVNRTYLQHDYYTDIITFDYCEGATLHSDIVISTETVASNARQLGKTFDDELRRVIIHGVLHLCGLGDKTPALRRVMEKAEDDALALWEETD